MGTSTPAFLGYTVGGPAASTPPTLVRSWSEFVDTFHFRSPMGREEVERALDGMPAAIEEATATLRSEEATLRDLATTGNEPVVTPDEFDKLVAVRTADWAGEPVSEEARREVEAVAQKVSTALPRTTPSGSRQATTWPPSVAARTNSPS
ncbi:hypothetical protein [Streptomyces luteoverticillatus]|uniref:hypothetical protein n=1 Tax=Streptomyces luteoverticillatus TaxID=66425 RepID=UPI0013DECB02|nr:hypothetical protein [Streptomyces luteoverticillatus]